MRARRESRLARGLCERLNHGREHGAAMKLADIMTTRVVTIELDDSLATVKEIFDSVKFRHLLVVEEGELFGVVSDRDLLRALSPFIGTVVETTRDLGTLNMRVHQIATRKPLTLTAADTVADAIQLFLANRISCIPIVDDGMRPVGIVSWLDILRTFAAEPPRTV
jgi:acetoin utilization protein AcuB